MKKTGLPKSTGIEQEITAKQTEQGIAMRNRLTAVSGRTVKAGQSNKKTTTTARSAWP